MLRRHKTSVVTPQPCPPITGEADPKPEPSAARISSHVYQSKGAPGGDCPPTPGVYSAMDYPQTPDGDDGDSPQSSDLDAQVSHSIIGLSIDENSSTTETAA